MKRRNFMQSLLGLLAAPVVGGAATTTCIPLRVGNSSKSAIGGASTVSVPPTVPSPTTVDPSLFDKPTQSPTDAASGEATTSPSRRLLLQESPLAGFQYHAGEHLWPALGVGAPLALRRERHNPHDERAVAIHYAGQRIGYLPRMENTAISQLMDRGEKLSARIAGLRKCDDPWGRLRLAIELLI